MRIESEYEKVVLGVMCCSLCDEEDVHCSWCPYTGNKCSIELKKDLLSLLWKVIPQDEFIRDRDLPEFLKKEFQIRDEHKY